MINNEVASDIRILSVLISYRFGEWLLGAISRAVRKIHYEYRLIIKGECNLTIRRSIRHVGGR